MRRVRGLKYEESIINSLRIEKVKSENFFYHMAKNRKNHIEVQIANVFMILDLSSAKKNFFGFIKDEKSV